MYGDISHRMAEQLRKPEVADFFARLIQRVSPKSFPQAMAEVSITRKFYENFGSDQVSINVLALPSALHRSTEGRDQGLALR